MPTLGREVSSISVQVWSPASRSHANGSLKAGTLAYPTSFPLQTRRRFKKSLNVCCLTERLCPLKVTVSPDAVVWMPGRSRLRYARLSHFSHVQLFVTPWTVACQAPLSMGILQAGILEWVTTSLSIGMVWRGRMVRLLGRSSNSKAGQKTCSLVWVLRTMSHHRFSE